MAAVSQEADVHAAASVIKQFFRDLPDSLIPRDQYQKFISASKMMVWTRLGGATINISG